MAGMYIAKFQKRKELKEISKENMNYYDKILEILGIPFDYLRKLTMLPCEADNYNKYYTYVWPFFGIPFTFWAVSKPSILWVVNFFFDKF